MPYCDADPCGQTDRIFEIAWKYDVDIDMHLDMADTTDGMQAEYVCRKTEEFGYGGRFTVGRCRCGGVALTILLSTDLYLMGRPHKHRVPRCCGWTITASRSVIPLIWWRWIRPIRRRSLRNWRCRYGASNPASRAFRAPGRSYKDVRLRS